MKNIVLLIIFYVFNYQIIYSQNLPHPGPGTRRIVSDFGPRNTSTGTKFHGGIDYPTELSECRVAVAEGVIRSFGVAGDENNSMISFGDWGYRHMQWNCSPDNNFEFTTIDNRKYLIVRADKGSRTVGIYYDKTLYRDSVTDPRTKQKLPVSRSFNAGDVCFYPCSYPTAPHLHLERRNKNIENPFSWIQHIDVGPPRVSKLEFRYPNSGEAVPLKNDNKNTIFGNNLIIVTDVYVNDPRKDNEIPLLPDKKRDYRHDGDMDVLELFYRKENNNIFNPNQFQSLHRWQYTNGPGFEVSSISSINNIRKHINNPIYGMVYPEPEVVSHDFFKFGWNIQERGSSTSIFKLKDGYYTIRSKAIDISRNSKDRDSLVLLDNLKPYVTDVHIYQGSKIIYQGGWLINSKQLDFYKLADNESKGDQNLTIIVYTSEPMRSVDISIPKLNIKNASCKVDKTFNPDDDCWKYELSKYYFQKCNKEIDKLNGKIELEIMGLDLAYNWIEGFEESENSKTISNTPIHQGDGTWKPAAGFFKADKKHSFKIKIEPLTCSWTASLITPGRCWIPPIYMLKPTAKGGRPFESGDPYKFSWSFKIVTSADETITLDAEDQFCKETTTGRAGTIPPGGCPKDPNDIIGPKGYGERQMVSVKETLPYKIRFENDPNAVSPAQKVVVKYSIDKNVDMYSVELGEFGFGDYIFQIPSKSSNYSARLDVVDSLGAFVDVMAGLDIAKRELFWIFQTIDPKTGTKPFGFDLGFLPQNDSTHRGEGFVTFKINPIRTAQTGDTIYAQADIVFDREKSMLTNKVFNTIDARPPVTRVKPLPSTIDSTQLRVTFTGTDDMGGSGIAKYELYVSENKGAYYQYNTSPGDTSILFDGSMGNTYDFYTRSWDNVYNSERNKGFAEASVVIKPKSIIISPNATSHFCMGNKLKIVWRNTNIDAFDIELSDDNAKTFKTIASHVLAYDTIFVAEIPANIDLQKNYVIRLVNSLNKLAIETSEPFKFYPPIKVNAGLDRLVCNQDSVQLGANPAATNGVEPYIFQWLNSTGLSSSSISNPYAYYEDSYVLEVHDAYGCWNRDTVEVTNSNDEKFTFYGLDEKYCLQASPITLSATPSGGLFTGLGVVDNVFYPKLAGSGYHTITYTHTNSNGCKKDTAANVEVLQQSEVILSGINSDYCIESDTVQLGAEPVGGFFSGNGVVNNRFIPKFAGQGLHKLKYTFSDTTGCIGIYDFYVNVHSKPDLTIVDLNNSYCVNSPLDTLRGIPADGIFNGDGILNNILDPSKAGVGNHTITFSYTSEYGCSNSITKDILINPLPSLAIVGLSSQYCQNAQPISLVGNPANGTFSGTGVENGMLYPSRTQIGSNTIHYTFTDANTCTNTTSQQVSILKKPNVTFLGLDDTYCLNFGQVNIIGKPSGGLFSGNGVVGNTFSTTSAGLGSHIVTYSFTDNNGCTNDSLKFVKVNPLPSVNIGRDTSITTVEMITLDAGNGFKTYQWSDGSTGQTLVLSGATLGKGTHKYWVEVSDNNGCYGADTILVKVSDNVDIDILNSLVKLQVYPNPSSGLFYLEIENESSENIHVEIQNNAGQLVYSKKFKGRFEDIKTEINLTDKAKGIYFLNVKVKREQITRKIVII